GGGGGAGVGGARMWGGGGRVGGSMKGRGGSATPARASVPTGGYWPGVSMWVGERKMPAPPLPEMTLPATLTLPPPVTPLAAMCTPSLVLGTAALPAALVPM